MTSHTPKTTYCTPDNTLEIRVTFLDDDESKPRFSIFNSKQAVPDGFELVPLVLLRAGDPACLCFRLEGTADITFGDSETLEWFDITSGWIVPEPPPGFQQCVVSEDERVCWVMWQTDQDAMWTAASFHIRLKKQGRLLTGPGQPVIDPTIVNKPWGSQRPPRRAQGEESVGVVSRSD